MKFFFALIQSSLLAIVAWFFFGFTVQRYQAFADLDATTLAQQYMTEKVQRNGKEEPKYATLAEATAQAEMQIAVGKGLLRAGTVKISTTRIALTVSAAVAGFLAWLIAYFIVYITTMPLTTLLDSIWGNFVRYFLAPSATTTVLGFVSIFVASEVIVQYLLSTACPNIESAELRCTTFFSQHQLQ